MPDGRTFEEIDAELATTSWDVFFKAYLIPYIKETYSGRLTENAIAEILKYYDEEARYSVEPYFTLPIFKTVMTWSEGKIQERTEAWAEYETQRKREYIESEQAFANARQAQEQMAAREAAYTGAGGKIYSYEPSLEQYYQQAAAEQANAAIQARTEQYGVRAPEEELPTIPALEEPFETELGKMTPAEKSYYQSRLGTIYSEFERAHPGAREAWWRTLNAPPAPTGTGGVSWMGTAAQPTAPTGYGATGWDVPAAWTPEGLSWGAWTSPEYKAPVKAKDPWEEYLTTKPWYQEFMAIPREQRPYGYAQTRFAPKVRWTR